MPEIRAITAMAGRTTLMIVPSEIRRSPISSGASAPTLVAAALAQLVEVEVVGAHTATLCRRQRRRLQVGQDRPQAVVADRLARRGDGLLRADEQRRRGERLHLVAAPLGLRRRHRRPAEVLQAEPSVVDDDVLVVDLAVGHPRAAETIDQRPQVVDEPGRLDRVPALGEGHAAAAQHEHGVVLDGRAGGDDDVRGDALLVGEQREEGLVLDLLEAPEAQRGIRLAVPDGAPDGGRASPRRGRRARRP